MSVRSGTQESFWASPLAFVGSLCLHAALAWLIITNMNSCGQQGNFGAGAAEEFREVGVYVVDDVSEPSEEEPSENATPSEQPLPELPAELNTSLSELPDLPATLPDLSSQPLIGPGPPTGGGEAANIAEMFATAAATAPLSAEGIPSTTSFFEIDTRGRTIVYIIDCSGSMAKHNAFRNAKAELLASLERLDPNHKFQVIFYSDQLFEFRNRRGEVDLHWATAANLTLARAYINSMDHTGGTQHMPALMKALSYGPEVIFFLTDGAEPSMSARQLDEVARKSNGKTAIHCIEFGLGPDLQIENFLHRLSRQNGGTYRYRDMSKFGR